MSKELLKQLGFRDKEIDVYLTVLQHGKITPGDLAKITKINRTTIYSVAKELTRKGVITEDLGGPASYLVALPPEELESIVQNQEKELVRRKKMVQNAIAELKVLAKKTKYSIPKIVFIPEKDLEKYLYKRTPIWIESVVQRDGIWWGFQDHTFVRHYQDWIDWFWRTKDFQETETRLLTNQSDIEEEMKEKKYERRGIKFWDQSEKFTASTWVSGDYLIMLITKQRPHYLVEVHDQVLAKNMRELFKGIWQKLS